MPFILAWLLGSWLTSKLGLTFRPETRIRVLDELTSFSQGVSSSPAYACHFIMSSFGHQILFWDMSSLHHKWDDRCSNIEMKYKMT